MLTDRLAIHCRNRLQSLQRTRAAAEDTGSPSASEPLSGAESLPSPSLSSFSIPSPSSRSGSLTHLPGEILTHGDSSTSPTIPIYDGESDRRFNLEVPPGTHQNESFHISPQAQHEFSITISTPNNDPAGCWKETIPPSELWKDCPPESSIVGENVHFYQPPGALAVNVDPPAVNNSSSHPPILFTMTCPVPHCCYQCQTVAEIWRHITWIHVHPQPDDGVEGIVEKVVLGNV